MLNEQFQLTDYNNFDINKNHKISMKKDIQLVKGSDMYKGFYEQSIVSKIFIRYYQITMFDEHGKRAVRSYLLEGNSSKGACYYSYNIIEIKNFKISEEKLLKFIKILNETQKKSSSSTKMKIMYKYYPSYDLDNTEAPTGDELNQCSSELLT